MDSIDIAEIAEVKRRLDFELLKIRIQFPIATLQSLTAKVLETWQPIQKDGHPFYRSLGLQFADDNNPLYDAVGQIAFVAEAAAPIFYRDTDFKNFTKLNAIGELYRFVFEAFTNTPYWASRILIADSGHISPIHEDAPDDCRIHIPITTNDGCAMHFGAHRYHLPADGGAYICNASRPHSFENLGETSRIHLVMLV